MVAIRRIALAVLAVTATCAVARPQLAKAEPTLAVADEAADRNGPLAAQSIDMDQSADASDDTSTAPLASASEASSSSSGSGSAEHGKSAASECLAAGVEDWDSRLQIGGVFIIMATGFAGAMLPIVSRHVEWLAGAARVFTVGKFFGAGVILATSFVHMLGAAIETLGDQCLDGRMGDYESWPALLAMLAILAMHLMEHVLHRRMARACASAGGTGDAEVHAGEKDHAHAHAVTLLADERRKRLSTYILELGIALHSVIIGMTLAVTGGAAYKTLLAAISVHQFFEGMAVGSRVSTLDFGSNAFVLRTLNAAVFALTTPLGQAIGIGIRQSFAPRSPSSLITMGVLESLSAGILMYSAIVNLLIEEFAAAEFNAFSRTLRAVCFAATYLGCAAMSIIGKWA
ncbi:hypothetical protein H4R19_002452 [Coemansia spiralis]|nr:hypothetical protein H4R19_002452 [Coemansia spiralis]